MGVRPVRSLVSSFLIASLMACGSADTSGASMSDASATGGSGGDVAAGGASGGDSGGATGGASGSGGTASSGGSEATGGNVVSGTGGADGGIRCDYLPGRCTVVCEAGQCQCQCDCGAESDCTRQSPAYACVPPGEPAPPCCGTGPMCSTSQDCGTLGDGTPMLCTGGLCASCIPPCVDDAWCGDGYRCGTDGLCARARCDTDGFACPAHSTCDGQNPESDSHGCLHDPCTTDSDCSQGACVNGRCWDAAGSCSPILCA